MEGRWVVVVQHQCRMCGDEDAGAAAGNGRASREARGDGRSDVRNAGRRFSPGVGVHLGSVCWWSKRSASAARRRRARETRRAAAAAAAAGQADGVGAAAASLEGRRGERAAEEAVCSALGVRAGPRQERVASTRPLGWNGGHSRAALLSGCRVERVLVCGWLEDAG